MRVCFSLWVLWCVLFPFAPLWCREESLRTLLLSEDTVPRLSWELLEVYPHDPAAFTQGLFLEDGVLYESTGLCGQSSLRMVDLATGSVVQKVTLDDAYFAEGATAWRDTIVQLTWTSRVAFVYDKRTLERLAVRPYPYEGWGVTTDGEHLIVSDGSATLRFLDPETFVEKRSIEVRIGGREVRRLNELEYAEGNIYANVWQEDVILVIDPRSGRVLAWIDLGALHDPGKGGENVLNGIAYDTSDGTFLITGKRWHRVYRIQVKGTAADQ